MLNCEDLEFFVEGRVRGRLTSFQLFRHETGSCYNSGMQCPYLHQTSNV